MKATLYYWINPPVSIRWYAVRTLHRISSVLKNKEAKEWKKNSSHLCVVNWPWQIIAFFFITIPHSAKILRGLIFAVFAEWLTFTKIIPRKLLDQLTSYVSCVITQKSQPWKLFSEMFLEALTRKLSASKSSRYTVFLKKRKYSFSSSWGGLHSNTNIRN